MSNPAWTEIAGAKIAVFDYNGELVAYHAVDKATNATTTIDYAHHEIHSGSMFRVGELVVLENNATRDIHIKTPNTTKYAHAEFFLSSTYEVEFALYEGATASVPGTALTTFNKNRNSAGTATVLLYHTPTVDPVGTLLMQRREGAGKVSGTQTREAAEWILKKNTSYLYRITSRGGAGTSNQVNWHIIWYEHTDKVVIA